MTQFNIALAQYPIKQHQNLKAWQTHVSNWVQSAVAKKAKLLVFPEYGSIELSSLLAENLQTDLKSQVRSLYNFFDCFKDLYSNLAKQNNIYILAPSFPVIDNNKNINRSYFFNTKGEYHYQDKLCMTRFEEEYWNISSGACELKVFQTSIGKIGINICFDVEFPQYAFELAQAGVEILLTPSCTESLWGLSRVHIAARARALENQFYVGVSGTIGSSSWSPIVDLNTGQAALYAPADTGFKSDGVEAIGELNQEMWLFAEVDLNKIKNVRENGQVFNFKKAKYSMTSNPNLKIKFIDF